MAEKKQYIVNPETGNKFPIGGCMISDKPSDLPKFGAMPRMFPNLPPSVDLRQMMTPVEHQQIGINSCVGNALAGAYEFLIMKNKRMHIDVSRLFIYYNGRLIGNNYQEYGLADQGTFIHTAIEGLKRFGCCKEASFPYHKAYVSQKPPPQCYDEAVHYRIADSMSVDCNLNEMKACLAEGYPFAFGLQLFQSSAYAERNGGVMHDPTPYDSQAPVHGWHAMLAVGYSDTSQCFIVRNSWGDQWGDQGYCYISYNYMCNRNYCKDLHAIKAVTEYRRQDPDRNVAYNNPYQWNTHKDQQFYIPPNYPYQDFDPQFFWNNNDVYNYFGQSSSDGQNIPKIWQMAKKSLEVEDDVDDPNSPKVEDSSALFLWIDKNSDSHTYVVNQLSKDSTVKFEFCDTMKEAEDYMIKYKEKIRFLSSFRIICRGYYANENKNPLNLLKFLLEKRFQNIKVFVFTQDKQGVEHHLEKQAPSFNLHDWQQRLTVIESSDELIQQIQRDLTKKRF